MARVEPRPGGARPRPGIDAGLRGFARFVLRLLFREVSLSGDAHFPPAGPGIVVANHSNSLVDGAILLAFLPRIPRFLAASTVWDYRPVAPFMNASGSVKVFRQQDGRAHEGSLEDSFADAAALLADGGMLAVFPEGRTHDDPALLPFKTGTARIAQYAEDRHGPLELAIIPVGIDYEVKNGFRTRAAFTFGAPVRLETATLSGPGEDPGADRRGDAGPRPYSVRAATTHLERALSAVAPDFADAAEARAMGLAGEILALGPEVREGHAPGYQRIVDSRHDVTTAFLAAETVDAAHDTRAALDAYAEALDASGLADHALAAPPGRRSMLRTGLALLPGLPLLAVAALVSGPQALLLGKVSATKPRDRQMTWKAFGGLVVYPLSWALWALVLGLVVGAGLGVAPGWAVALGVMLLAPVVSWAALPTFDRAARLLAARRARRILDADPDLAPRLLGLRAEARAALDRLLGDANRRTGGD